MPKAAFTTLGCKVNQYETQKILESFEEAGFEVVPFDAVADVYVVNTCSVTGQAESKSRYTVRKARRTNPDAKVVVTQPARGQYKAFSAVCTHVGCIMSEVANGTIDCPCHGGQFKVTNGAVVAGPPPSPLPARQVKVVNGQVILL